MNIEKFHWCTFLCLYFLLNCCAGTVNHSIDKFSWLTGHDAATIQVIPARGISPIAKENGKKIVHVKFRVHQYGEVSFPINTTTPEGAEALPADLSIARGIKITYRSNQELILQLRQTAVHGGVHNHVVLSSAKTDTTVVISFAEFKDGKISLDLTDVAKFNFAFLSNNPEDGYAELRISDIEIK